MIYHKLIESMKNKVLIYIIISLLILSNLVLAGIYIRQKRSLLYGKPSHFHLAPLHAGGENNQLQNDLLPPIGKSAT